jgi:hypothetical protein
MRTPPVPLALGLAVFGFGCAGSRATSYVPIEHKLRDAGFRVEVADTKEELAEISVLPPHRIVPQARDGRTVYVFPDAAGCHCAYVGSEEAYAALERLLQEDAARERRRVEAEAKGGRLDWGFRHPWVARD